MVIRAGSSRGWQMNESMLGFRTAIETWLQSRTFGGGTQRHRYISARTLHDYRQYAKALNSFFGDMLLANITAEGLREYQTLRALHVGPNKINQEMGVATRVLKVNGAWKTEHERFYEPLVRQESDVPRALTPQEQERWLDAASSSEKWRLVYCYSLAGLCSTCSSNELRGLQVGSVNLNDGVFLVRSDSAKNKHRIRTIPLDDKATWALEWLLHRARMLGSTQPNHFVFPFRVNLQAWDCSRHMTEWGIRKCWDEVKEASGVTTFRPNDIRHTAITRYAEAGTPIQVLMSIAGHISPKMQMHYTWISEQAKRKWQSKVSEIRTQRFGPSNFEQVAIPR